MTITYTRDVFHYVDIYTMGNFISTSIHNYLNESKAYPFSVSKEPGVHANIRYVMYRYSFNIDGVDFTCGIFPNLWKKKCYDVAFATKGGSTKDRVGRNLEFMNSVLKTIAECMIDFINDNDAVRILSFQGDKIREKAYVRFFKNHPYFSKYLVDDTHEYSGFVEIHIDKGIEKY